MGGSRATPLLRAAAAPRLPPHGRGRGAAADPARPEGVGRPPHQSRRRADHLRAQLRRGVPSADRLRGLPRALPPRRPHRHRWNPPRRSDDVTRGSRMSTRLEHKTALVTGATSNIGRAIATAFAAEGAHVLVSGRSKQRGAEGVDAIRSAGGRAEFIAADLDGSAQASLGLAADATRALGGRIDVLVNTAGIFPGSTTPTAYAAMFDEVYGVN